MKEFLITYEVTLKVYMGDHSTEKKSRIVHAEDKYSAEDKLTNHYEGKNQPYSHNYNVDIISTAETLK